MDLLALAYQTDLTRVSTFMLGKEVSGRGLSRESGFPTRITPCRTTRTSTASSSACTKVNEYHFQQFAHLVARMEAMPEGDGTLLDTHGPPLRDRHQRQQHALPRRPARRGGSGGQSAGIRGGRYVRHPQGTPIANLYVALLDRLGVHVDSFGDSTGRLETLT